MIPQQMEHEWISNNLPWSDKFHNTEILLFMMIPGILGDFVVLGYFLHPSKLTGVEQLEVG